MHFTGERYLPSEIGKIRLEHYHRYAAVQQIIAGKNVLDIACGEGYGSFLMADTARSVIGADISIEAVEHASSLYQKSNLVFCQENATHLSFADSKFDVVVSFETIEHLLEQAQMLAEIKRVLRPDGFLVISSPNRPIYSEESGEHNHFHVRELDFNEFDELLKTQFRSITYFGQRMLMGSIIQSLEKEKITNTMNIWNDNGRELKRNAGDLTDPVYFLAVCGNNNISLPKIDTSALFPSNLDLVKHYVSFAKWAKTVDKQVEEHAQRIAQLTNELEEEKQKFLKISKLNNRKYLRTLSAGCERILSRVKYYIGAIAKFKYLRKIKIFRRIK